MDPIPDDHPLLVGFVEAYTALQRVLDDDLSESVSIYLAKPDDQFARRLFVRAVISNIEGQMAAVREHLLFFNGYFSARVELDDKVADLADKLNHPLSIKDSFALAGKSLKDVKRGNAVIRDEILCAEETIKFFYGLHGRVYGHDITPTAESDGWQALVEVKQKRNQLTHPKCVEDLDVTNEQARRAVTVFIWMRGYLDRIRAVEHAKWELLSTSLPIQPPATEPNQE